MTSIDELERDAARHWQAPETESLGEWLLRAADGFTGRANSALPLGDPGLPLPEAVACVTDWYRRRRLPPMIVVPHPLASTSAFDTFLAERTWALRPGPAIVMTAAIADIPALDPGNPALDHDNLDHDNLDHDNLDHDNRVQFDPEPDAAWLARYRYRAQELPPIARTLLMSAPWQAFASVRRDGAAVAVGRISVAGGWGAITGVEVDPACRRQGLATTITSALAAAAAARGADRMLLQVLAGNTSARTLYARCGFRDSHRFHYRIAPTR